jgi:hypothetical protein
MAALPSFHEHGDTQNASRKAKTCNCRSSSGGPYQQRTVHLDISVVANKSQLTKFIHLDLARLDVKNLISLFALGVDDPAFTVLIVLPVPTLARKPAYRTVALLTSQAPPLDPRWQNIKNGVLWSILTSGVQFPGEKITQSVPVSGSLLCTRLIQKWCLTCSALMHYQPVRR